MSLSRRDFLLGTGALAGCALAFPPAGISSTRATHTAASQADWLVRGTVCTMNDRREVLPGAAVAVVGSTVHLLQENAPGRQLESTERPVVGTDGFIYPGLLDLHKHITYDIHGPWFPARKFRNRTEFFFDPVYRRTVENPCRLLVQYADLLNEVCLYAEVKALAGGTTALQGAAIHDPGYTTRLVRNVEFENFNRDRVHQTIWDVSEATAPALHRLMSQLDGWIYHLSEGVDEYAQQKFAELKKFGLLTDKLVAIHAVGLTPAELSELAEAGASLVWGPLGNLRLYGQTTDIRAAHAAGLRLCLGSEWAPSGSKNLLTDLKVADQYNQKVLDGLLNDRELVEMVTVNPAAAVGWDGRAGQLVDGAAADLVVVRKRNNNPYRNLIEATEEDVELVVVSGRPVYGDPEVMESLGLQQIETLRPRRGRPKALAFRSEDDCRSFSQVRQRLEEVLRLEEASLARDLNRLKVRRALTPDPPPVQQEYPFFLAIGDEPLSPQEVERFLQAVFPEGVAPFVPDPIFVADDDEFARVLSDPALVERGLDLVPYFDSLLS